MAATTAPQIQSTAGASPSTQHATAFYGPDGAAQGIKHVKERRRSMPQVDALIGAAHLPRSRQVDVRKHQAEDLEKKIAEKRLEMRSRMARGGRDVGQDAVADFLKTPHAQDVLASQQQAPPPQPPQPSQPPQPEELPASVPPPPPQHLLAAQAAAAAEQLRLQHEDQRKQLLQQQHFLEQQQQQAELIEQQRRMLAAQQEAQQQQYEHSSSSGSGSFSWRR